KSQALTSTPRHLFDRHASLEVGDGVEIVYRCRMGMEQRIDEGLVLLARQWTVEIRSFRKPVAGGNPGAVSRHGLFAVARRPKGDLFVDRVAGHDWRDRVVERERFGAERRCDRPRQGVGGEWSSRDDTDLRKLGNLAALDGNARGRR